MPKLSNMKRILVPTDFSLCAAKALDYAVELAQHEGGQILLLHSCDLLGAGYWTSKSFGEEHNRCAKKELYHKLHLLKEKLENTYDVRISVWLDDRDDVGESILAIAGEAEADLIVMGTRGDDSHRRETFGSTVAHVISKSVIPVLTVSPQQVGRHTRPLVAQ